VSVYQDRGEWPSLYACDVVVGVGVGVGVGGLSAHVGVPGWG